LSSSILLYFTFSLPLHNSGQISIEINVTWIIKQLHEIANELHKNFQPNLTSWIIYLYFTKRSTSCIRFS